MSIKIKNVYHDGKVIMFDNIKRLFYENKIKIHIVRCINSTKFDYSDFTIDGKSIVVTIDYELLKGDLL